MSPSPDLAPAISAFRSGDLDRARSLAEKAAPSAEAEHLLGLIHCRRGDLEAGVSHLRRAAEADAANPAYQVMLARSLVDAGRAAEVLEMPEPQRDGTAAALALWHVRAEAATAADRSDLARDAWRLVTAARPDDWRAWSNLGNACAAAEQWDECAAALSRAAALNPGEAPIRRNLAAALGNSFRTEAAVGELAVAVRLETGHVETRLMLARLLVDLGRDEEALQQLNEALKVTPDSVEAAKQRGRQLISLTRFDEAERDYWSALAVAPDDRGAIHELGLLLERTNRIDALRELLEQAAEAGIGREQLSYLWAAVALRDGRPGEARDLLALDPGGADPERWHRLRARAADALGDVDAAFAESQAMKRSVHDFEGWRQRGAAHRQSIRRLAAVITPAWVESLAGLAPGKRRRPAFLVGFPRSGTTLLDTFLMGHPDTAVLEELPMLEAAKKVVGDVTALAGCSEATLERARAAYFVELDRHVEPGFDGLVVDKLPLNMLGGPLIHSLFPEAPIIFAQRHPCDAVLSGFMQSFVMNDAMACFLDVADAADLYDAAMTVWTLSRDLLPLSVQTLVYEELVSDPAGALRPLVEFLGLEWSEDMLDHRTTAKERGAIMTPSYDQVSQPLTRAPVGRWRRYEVQLATVLPVLLPWAKKLGYPD